MNALDKSSPVIIAILAILLAAVWLDSIYRVLFMDGYQTDMQFFIGMIYSGILFGLPAAMLTIRAKKRIPCPTA